MQTLPEVDELLSRQTPAVRRLASELRGHLKDDGVVVYTTNATSRGDVRHAFTRSGKKKRHPFSVMRFEDNCLWLILRVGEGTVHDPDFEYNDPTHKDHGRTKLAAHEAIPAKVLRWILIAKRFTKEQYG
jgi:hypothetical protein